MRSRSRSSRVQPFSMRCSRYVGTRIVARGAPLVSSRFVRYVRRSSERTRGPGLRHEGRFAARRPAIKLEPLRNQRVVADLATDMVDFHARFEPAGLPQVRTSEVCAGAVPPDGMKAFGRFEDCIECGLCLSACPIARTDRAYIGPAALAAAARVVAEPRGRDLGHVLALAEEPDSVWRCHDAMECTAVCPSAVGPGPRTVHSSPPRRVQWAETVRSPSAVRSAGAYGTYISAIIAPWPVAPPTM